MITEEEAREKVCPFIQLVGQFNDVQGSHKLNASNCIGSDCMAWEETKNYKDKYGDTTQLDSEGCCRRLKCP